MYESAAFFIDKANQRPGSHELSNDQHSLVPPCQDPPTHRHRLRTDKGCAQRPWIIHELKLPQMRGVVHEAVLCTANVPQRSR